MVLRRIRALDRPARMRITLDVRSGYGAPPMSGLSLGDGVWTGHHADRHLAVVGVE